VCYTYLGSCTDKAGNLADSATVSGINIDKTAPSISGAPDRAANAFGWYNADVTVSFSAADALSGLLASSDPTTLGEGAGQSVLGTATDLAGNVATYTVAGINIDKTAPNITAQRDTAANAFGWNNTAVSSSYAASDGLSGLLSPASASGNFLFAAEGAGQSHLFTVTDLAGNSASAIVSNVNIDLTAPTLNAHRDTPANAFGWNNTNVLTSYTAGDALSGLDSPASGSFTFTADGANQSHTYTVTDKAGNATSYTIANVNIDRVAPVLTLPGNIVTAPNNAAGAIVNYISSGADALSGVASFTKTPGSGSLFAVGTTLVNATLTDKAGNTVTGTFNVTVQSAGVGSDGNLWILAPGCGANITVDANNRSSIRVTGAGAAAAGPFALAPGKRVVVIGTACADTITVNGSVDAELRGLAGNDTLTGGAANDVIDGGAGADNLVGAAGDDVLYGGDDASASTGGDRLVGAAGNDILIAVRVSDSSFTELDSLRTLWMSRVQGIGNYSLDDDGASADDGSDMLTGSAGADWFIIGHDDKITDLGNAKKSLSTGWVGDDYVEII
jgi:Ca2+-binding RTX toxin-like protein